MRPEIPLGEPLEAAAEPFYECENEFTRDEFSQEVESALSQLPETFRWAILLADVEEMSYQEIAGVMNCPVGTVMSRVSRGRRMLARILRRNSVASGSLTRESEKKFA